MLQKIKKILLNPWLIAIISPIITTTVVAVIKDVNFIDAFKYIINTIKIILEYKVSVKIIILIILMMYIILKIYTKTLEFKEEQKPKWLSYTKYRYKEWYFKWNYIHNYNTYSIDNVRPICECGCGLNYKVSHHNRYYTNGVLVCPKCDNSYNAIDEEIIDELKTIVYHNIETNNYETYINNVI